MQAATAVVAERRLQRRVVRDERGAVAGPVLGATERVDLKADAGDPERMEESPRDLDDLGVQRGRALADALDTDLGELMLAARLGPFGTEERARVVHPNRPDLLVEMRAEHGTESSGGALGPEGEGAPAAILEGEHLLLDDVGVGAHPAAEQLSRFDDRCLDGAVSEGFRDRAVGLEQPPAGGELIGQDVARSFGRCDLGHWRPSVRARGCCALCGLSSSGAIGETVLRLRGVRRRASVRIRTGARALF